MESAENCAQEVDENRIKVDKIPQTMYHQRGPGTWSQCVGGGHAAPIAHLHHCVETLLHGDMVNGTRFADSTAPYMRMKRDSMWPVRGVVSLVHGLYSRLCRILVQQPCFELRSSLRDMTADVRVRKLVRVSGKGVLFTSKSWSVVAPGRWADDAAEMMSWYLAP